MFWRNSDDDPMFVPEYLYHASQMRRAPVAYVQAYGLPQALRLTASMFCQIQGFLTVPLGIVLFR